MVLLLDLVQALNELRLLLLVTGRCYLVLELFELPLVVDDLGRITKIVVAMPTVAVFAHFTADWTLTGSRASCTNWTCTGRKTFPQSEYSCLELRRLCAGFKSSRVPHLNFS